MAAHEVVTIQAGQYANFVGCHWWNMQESSFCYTPDKSIPLDINHDVMFRQGLNLQREDTYTPRLVLVDLKTNLVSIRKECPLYRYPKEDQSEMLWDGAVDVIKDPPVRKNPFLEEFEKAGNPSKNSEASSGTENEVACESLYNFNSSTTVWSDFLKTIYIRKVFAFLMKCALLKKISPFNCIAQEKKLILNLERI
ncbi:protein misato homolog 1-like isoform X2 [Stegodyphus dumicola]|uniref:protein misato homolog 1-like isoform X2 n=1 Tax=Stegodyphus dumicola TaxID=202533 RepID=UPI0015AF7C49|nr:protein misato homolog 1-like isoform X2 [Stegodyphus dumicola]